MIRLKFKEWLKINEVQYLIPNFDFEWEEANRYPEFQALGKEKWLEFAKTGRPINVNIDQLKNISNTDAGKGEIELLNSVKRKRFESAYLKRQVEMPIVVKFRDGHLELIAGNTRLTGLIEKEGIAQVWLLNLENINETPDIYGTTPPVQEPIKLGRYGALPTYEVPVAKYQKKCRKKMKKAKKD